MAPARRTTLLLASLLATIVISLGFVVPAASAAGRTATQSHFVSNAPSGDEGAVPGGVVLRREVRVRGPHDSTIALVVILDCSASGCRELASAPPVFATLLTDRSWRDLRAAQAPSGPALKAEIASGRVIDRYYDPTTGQFLSVDPDVDQTQQPYAYTGGDPVKSTDPSGQMYVGPDGQSGCGTLACVDESTQAVDAAAEAYEANFPTCSYSTWDCLVMTLDPAYSLVAGTVSAYDAAQQPCSSNWTIAGDSFDAALGLGGTVGVAFGGASVVDGLLGDGAGSAGLWQSLKAQWALRDDEGAITFGHGARHLAGTSLSVSEVEDSIASQIEASTAGATSTGSFWGQISIGGKTIEYRAYTLSDGTINVGTYYVVP